MKNKMIFPSCSETIFRLNIEKSIKEKIIDELSDDETINDEIMLSDDFPNGCLDNMIEILSEAKENDKDINNTELEFIETQGANSNFVEDCFKIAKRYLKGEITRKQADKLEEKSWDDEDDE